MRKLALVLLAVGALAPAGARAQSLGRDLDDPREGARVRVSVVSEVEGDRVTVGDASCRPPCALRLAPGTYAVELDSGPVKTLVLRDRPVLLSARPTNVGEQVLGVALIVGAAGIAGVLAATGDVVCWDFASGGCSPDVGPILVGVGAMALGIGVALAFDADQQVRVSELPRPR